MTEASQILKEFSSSILSIKLNNSFSKSIEKILQCKGTILTTGMGKAGIAMRKFSSTLCSLGFPSTYIHPGEALHGDIGLIKKNDIVFIASTSGKTREVLDFVNLLRDFENSCIICLTSHFDSPLRNKCNILIDIGIVSEAGILRMAPTTSILVIQAITDALALVAASERKITLKEYGKYHHAGYLGAMARKDGVIH